MIPKLKMNASQHRYSRSTMLLLNKQYLKLSFTLEDLMFRLPQMSLYLLSLIQCFQLFLKILRVNLGYQALRPNDR